MGTKVQFDSYLPGYCSMRDLNHDSDGTTWTSFYGDKNLPNGQYYYSLLPRPATDTLPGANKDILKQTILKHEAIFKNQVVELHRLYRVQKHLMDEMQRKEHYKQKIAYEASSSSSHLPSQMTPDKTHRRNSASFLFTNSVCDGPPVSVPEIIQSSAASSLQGKSIQSSPISLQKCGSPKDSEVSESRPTKVRKMIDLQLPADEYLDTDEVEQQGNGAAIDSREKLFPSNCGKSDYQKDESMSDLCSRKPSALADLNEPLQPEETSANPSVNFLGVPSRDHLTIVPGLSKDFPWNSGHGNINGTLNNFQYNGKGNQHHRFSSVLKAAEEKKDSGISIHQLGKASMSPSPVKNSHQLAAAFPPYPVKEDTWPAKTNDAFKMLDRTRSFSSYSNQEAVLPSQLPSYFPSSDLANSWDHSLGRPKSSLSQISLPVQTSPYLNSASLSKSPQSSVRSNEFLGNGWHANNHPRSNSGFAGESSVQNGFHQGSPSGFKELPAQLGKVAPVYTNNSYNDKAYSGSHSFLRGSNYLDLNSTGDLNCSSYEPLAKKSLKIADSEVKQEDPLSVLPWLRPKGGTSTNEAASARNGPNKVAEMPDHQNSVTSTCAIDAARAKGHHVISDHPSSSRKILGVPIFQRPSSGEEDIESARRKKLLDINVPCNEPEDTENVATMLEAVVREEKTETARSSGHRGMIDLNSCVADDEISSRASLANSSTADSMKLGGRAIIDLEAPIDLETEEDNFISGEEPLMKQHQLPLQSPSRDSTDSADQELARVAAEAIVAISSCAADDHVADGIRPHPLDEASGSDDALHWFADIVCLCPDDIKSCPDDNRDCLSVELDSFEEMTLKLTECTVEEYFPSPPVIDIPTMEEANPATIPGRTRRGPARRGRQRRDFQRDILPGLTSLSRHEVTEDLQTFGGLMKATGHAWHCGTRRNASRNGSSRGRRRSVAASPPPPPPPVTPPAANTTAVASQKQLLKNGEIILENRSLTSWGKTTRRPRRQRCPPAAGNLTPIALT